MKAKDGSERVGNLCGTALAYADVIQRRVVVNGETCIQVAMSLGFTPRQVNSVARIVRTFGGLPSLERLAVIAMQAPDISDEDIADWFGKLTPWATKVRAEADMISRREFIPSDVAWVADEWEPDDPTPEEIRQRAAEIRSVPGGKERPPVTPRIRTFSWHGGRFGTFFPVSP
jgi:hypothetical protein